MTAGEWNTEKDCSRKGRKATNDRERTKVRIKGMFLSDCSPILEGGCRRQAE